MPGRLTRPAALILFAAFVTLFAPLSGIAGAADAEDSAVLRVVYFIPVDMEPIEGYGPRMDRVMTEVQRFFREGMKSHGLGEMTFGLERDGEGKLVVRLVKGKEPKEVYGRSSYGIIYREIAARFAEDGLDMNRESVMVFTPLLFWDGKVAREHGAYCGGGNATAGMAIAYDDALLDPRELGNREPGGYYHRPVSIGQFNSHYIGGVAHELGHGLSLPHVKQRRIDSQVALMGAGNHTYGEELRGRGRGTFLTEASALMLSQVRVFAGDLPDASKPSTFALKEVEVTHADGKLIVTGQVEADPPVFAVIGYNDNADIPSNYDAVGWTAKVDDDGRFTLEIGELQPGKFDLNLRFLHKAGRSVVRRAPYTLEKDKAIDTDAMERAIQ